MQQYPASDTPRKEYFQYFERVIIASGTRYRLSIEMLPLLLLLLLFLYSVGTSNIVN